MTITTITDRAVVRVAGPDARAFLQGLLTSDMDTLSPAHPLYAGLLSPQGKALFDMMLFADGDHILIDIAASRAEALVRRLSMYRLRKAVTLAPTPLVVVAAWDGDAAGHTLDPRLAALGARWIAESAPIVDSYTAHRLAHGVPDSVDIGDDQLLWLETGADLLHGVSFTKGCYVGQENTARMHHRDKVRRRLVPLHITGETTGLGAIIVDSRGRSAGTLRSHHGRTGIAHLRLDAAGGPLTISDANTNASASTEATVLRPAWLAAAIDAATAA